MSITRATAATRSALQISRVSPTTPLFQKATETCACQHSKSISLSRIHSRSIQTNISANSLLPPVNQTKSRIGYHTGGNNNSLISSRPCFSSSVRDTANAKFRIRTIRREFTSTSTAYSPPVEDDDARNGRRYGKNENKAAAQGITSEIQNQNGGQGSSWSRFTTELPSKVKMACVSTTDREQLLNAPASFEIRQTFGSTYGGNYRMNWQTPPKSVLIVKKPNDPKTGQALVDVATWIHENYPDMNVIIEPDVATEIGPRIPFAYVIPSGDKAEYTRVTDLVVTLGGDGTILHTSSLFNSAVPPVISFSMGTLGFLLPFDIHHFRPALQNILDPERSVSLLLRMRLKCTLHGRDGRRMLDPRTGERMEEFTVMNEVNLHRGRYPHLTAIGCFVDGQLITEAVADGLIVASPTGSTAYSLSAGGSIVHPSIQTLLLTPICPRSLSFRPILLPPTSAIQLKMGDKSRGPAEVSFDGKETFFLERGEFLQVCMSPYPVPSVNRVHAGEDWAKDINSLLKWNQGFDGKQTLSHYMED